MSITFLHSHLNASAAPSQLSSRAADALRRALLAFWRAIEAYGEQRARQHMLRLACQYDYTYPETARQMRAAARGLDQ